MNLPFPKDEVYEAEKAANLAAYERLKDQIKREYADKYVAIAEGRIVAVHEDLFAAAEACDAAVPKAKHSWVFKGCDEPQIDELVIRSSLLWKPLDK